jgi:hypothetical protein
MTGSGRSNDSLGAQPMAHAPATRTGGSVGDGNLVEPIRIEEFFEGIATIYDLPAREGSPAAAPAPTGRTARRRNIRRERILIAALGILLAAWFGLRLVRFEPPAMLPEGLAGEWQTSEPRYHDKGFWLSTTEVGFRTGPSTEEATVHPIRKVTETAGIGDTTVFSVDYAAEGGVVTWKFQYVSSPRPAIRFLNQRELIWTRPAR